jgi:2-polyprenyl-3-methyl-5-hydroxy-6-metoxy-1,4-benzoquinol methylase
MPALKDRRITNCVRYVLDDWLPPVMREFRPLNQLMAVLFHGSHFDLDFKRKAHGMTDAEFSAAYARLPHGHKRPYRDTDMTEGQIRWMLAETLGSMVLEVGCGHGRLAQRLAEQKNWIVTATDLSCENVQVAAAQTKMPGSKFNVAVANIERLPFPDKSFDTTLCAHTLEHVRDFDRAVAELVRVTRQRLLIIVPCQRYYRYTIDYHLHFFPEPEQLILRMGLERHHCVKIQGDLCYRALL